LFGYYAILQANLRELEKDMYGKGRRRSTFGGVAAKNGLWAEGGELNAVRRFPSGNGQHCPWGRRENAAAMWGVKRMCEVDNTQQQGNNAGCW
jgi:hypothetical protein